MSPKECSFIKNIIHVADVLVKGIRNKVIFCIYMTAYILEAGKDILWQTSPDLFWISFPGWHGVQKWQGSSVLLAMDLMNTTQAKHIPHVSGDKHISQGIILKPSYQWLDSDVQWQHINPTSQLWGLNAFNPDCNIMDIASFNYWKHYSKLFVMMLSSYWLLLIWLDSFF